MSRFGWDDDGEGMPWGLWEATVARALGGRRGQEALAQLEAALLELPEPRLIEGHLAADGAVCAVGAFIARQRAQEQGVDLPTIVEAMSAGVKCWCGHGRDLHAGASCGGRSWADNPCGCTGYDPDGEGAWETADAGRAAGLRYSVAWHLAYLNDEEFGGLTPEARYERMLAWVRRAQGKVSDAVA
jgi:hypothetical protein